MTKLSKASLNFLVSVMRGVSFNGFDENVKDLGERAQEVGDWLRAELATAEAPTPTTKKLPSRVK